MARTAIPGGCKVLDITSAAADTKDFGTVTLMIAFTAATNSVAVQVGDSSTVDTTPTTTLIDPTTGDPMSIAANQSSGAILLCSYIGEKRYIQATTATGCKVYAILGEARKTGPAEA